MSNAMWIVISLSVSGSLIAGILFLLKPLLRGRVSRVFSYYVWLIVLLRMVLPISAPVNAIDALVQKAPVIEETVIEERVDAVVTERMEDVGAAELRDNEQIVIPQQSQMNEVQTEAVVQPDAKPADSQNFFLNAWDWLKDNLIVVWGAGALAVFLWFVVSYLRFSGKLSNFSSLPTEEDNAVFESLAGKSRATMLYNSAVSTPLMIGVLNPRILVPEREYVKSGQKKQLESLLKHELMHCRRRDILYKWAAVLVSSLHWFNPLMPLIRREIAQECEFSCDEMVIRSMTSEEKVVYGETMLSFAVRRELPKGIAAATFGERKTNLKARLSNIIAYHKKPLWIGVISLVLAIALAGCAVVTGVTRGKKAAYKTPEKLIEAYIEGINSDIPLREMMEFYATDEVRKYTDKKALEEMYPAYSFDEWFRDSEEINPVGVASAADTISLALYPKTEEEQQREFDEYFAGVDYSEMTREELIDFLSVPYEKHLSEIDQPIVIERIDDVEDSIDQETFESYKKAVERGRKTYGADDVRQLSVLISCGGKQFVRGFHLMKYNGAWKIFGHGVYLNVSSWLVEMTEAEYLELIGEEMGTQTVVQTEEQKALAEKIAEELAEKTVEYPRRYFFTTDGGVEPFIEINMPYKEVLSILEELQAEGCGEIKNMGVNSSQMVLEDGTRERDQKWIQYVENGETTIRFSFDREDRLSNMAWGENNESDSEALLMATIESEGIQPEFYKGDSRDYYLFSQGKGYYALIFTREEGTDDSVQISYAMMAENEPEKHKLGEKQPLDINLQHYPTAQELAEMQEQNPSTDHTAEIKYPRKYFDFTPEESGYDTFIELTMSYNEVLSILEEIQKEGNGEITKTGSNDSVSRNEAIPLGKWIHFEEYIQTDNGIRRDELGFWFDGNDRLFEIGGAYEDMDLDYVLNNVMFNTIVAENILPQYYGSDERDVFIFPREKPEYTAGYGIRILDGDTETGELRRYAWAVSLIDYRERYAQESKNNVFILFRYGSRRLETGPIPLKPEGSISPKEAIRIASEKTGGAEQAYFYRGYAIYNGEYYHALRKGSVIKEGEDPKYCYVSMDGKTVYEGTNHYIG